MTSLSFMFFSYHLLWFFFLPGLIEVMAGGCIPQHCNWTTTMFYYSNQQVLEQARVMRNELEELKVFSKSLEEENSKLHTEIRQLVGASESSVYLLQVQLFHTFSLLQQLCIICIINITGFYDWKRLLIPKFKRLTNTLIYRLTYTLTKHHGSEWNVTEFVPFISIMFRRNSLSLDTTSCCETRKAPQVLHGTTYIIQCVVYVDRISM